MPAKWSAWIKGITHEPKDGWFTRNESAFEALPTKVGGVYEIGIGTGTSPTRIVYCGRALKTEAGGGTALRTRLYSGYAKSGSHIHIKLRKELEAGKDVFFRWMILLDKDDIVNTEADMIATGKYPWNSVKSKGFVQKLEALVGDDPANVERVREWLKSREL